MLDSVTELVTASVWSYVLVAVLVAADGVVPIAPGETVVMTAAVLASSGRLDVALVLAAAFVGSLSGDNTSFGLGRTLGDRAARRLARRGRPRELLEWSREQLDRRGRAIIVGARFIPGGRIATTLTAGTVGMPWRRFAEADVTAAVLWSLYTTGLGYLGGATFRDNVWLAIAASFAVAVVVAGVAELVRRARMG